MKSGPRRLAGGGRIDRARSLNFSLDGRALRGFGGDTLASALLANGTTMIGRSFKYHRPRGFLSAGIEEPNGLFTIGTHGRTTPNVAGTVCDLHDGLAAACQNGWPSVRFDLMALTSFAAPLLPAGFYYKTFMGPRRGSWMFYEKFIRRAAGLGRAVHSRDPDRYDTQHLFADVLVIGSGPAGLSAALTAARARARVVLVEQDSLVGGTLCSSRSDSAEESWRTQMAQMLRALPNVDMRCRTTALGIYDGNTVALVERHDGKQPDPTRGEAREAVITLRVRAIVYATGAIERPLVFEDNDRPGVMLASAAQSYLNRFAVLAGGRIVIATNNDGAWHAGFDLAAGGAEVTILDQRRMVDPELRKLARKSGVAVETETLLTRALGVRCVRAVGFRTSNSTRERQLPCDLVCVSGGWSPTVHLTSHTGIKPVFREDIDSYVPGVYAAGHYGAGALSGTFALSLAIKEGMEAGSNAARHAGFENPALDFPLPRVADRPYRLEPARPPLALGRGKAFVDFQNDVTTRDLAIAHQEGFSFGGASEALHHAWNGNRSGQDEQYQRHPGDGGTCESSTCRSVGTTTFRPPYSPVSIGALGGPQHRPAIPADPPLSAARLACCEPRRSDRGGTLAAAWYYRWAGDSASSAYVGRDATRPHLCRHIRCVVAR